MMCVSFLIASPKQSLMHFQTIHQSVSFLAYQFESIAYPQHHSMRRCLAQTASHLTVRHVRHLTCDAHMKKKMVKDGGGASDPSQHGSGNDL